MKTSPITENIFRALNEVTKEITNPKNSKTVAVVTPKGKFAYKYAPLSEILELVRPLLSANGLSIMQELYSVDNKVGVSTLITHTSGEWLETEPFYLITEKDTAQGAGSGITYARRYALSAILGISSEDDDDGNAASNKEPQISASYKEPQISEEDADWFINIVIPNLKRKNVPSTTMINTANKFLHGNILKETIENSINK
jgi:hypothetical protein